CSRDWSSDVCSSDLQMPVMDGFTSTKEIRKHNSMVPVIALTASSINEVLNSIIDCGMNEYISKPFVPEMLYNKLCKYLLQEVVRSEERRVGRERWER